MKRYSAPAERCRWTAMPNAVSPPTRVRGAPGTVGPVTRAFLEVLQALLWGFPNSRSGCCFPSYEAIADRAGCARSTVAEALKVLEWAGVLTWQHRITRVREHCRDLFGHECWQWRVHRRSNAYAFRDPQQQIARPSTYQSESEPGTQNQDFLGSVHTPAHKPDSPLERALAQFGAAVAGKNGIERTLAEPPVPDNRVET
jgi:hypothetical protein